MNARCPVCETFNPQRARRCAVCDESLGEDRAAPPSRTTGATTREESALIWRELVAERERAEPVGTPTSRARREPEDGGTRLWTGEHPAPARPEAPEPDGGEETLREVIGGLPWYGRLLAWPTVVAAVAGYLVWSLLRWTAVGLWRIRMVIALLALLVILVSVAG